MTERYVVYGNRRLKIDREETVLYVSDLDDEPGDASPVEVPRTDTTPPLELDGPPAGWELFEAEDFSDYPLGPLTLKDPWQPKFPHDSEVLNGEKEQAIYVIPKVNARGVKYNPLSVVEKSGRRAMAITPRKTPASELAASLNKPFQSGVASSKNFNTYGYYESWHILPDFDGAWVAAWLMGPSWWPEFDMIEYVAKVHRPKNSIHCAIHYKDKVKATNSGDVGVGRDVTFPGKVSEWFKVGGLWHPNFLAVYINGAIVWQVPNPVKTDTIMGLHDPAIRLFSFTITGKSPDSWGGPTVVDPATLTPFYIAGVKSYKVPERF